MLNKEDRKRKSSSGPRDALVELSNKSVNGTGKGYEAMQSTAVADDAENNKTCRLCIKEPPSKPYLYTYNFIMPFIVIMTTATFGYLYKLPFIFPSLGPTAFLHFAAITKPPASPRNTICGHFIGILAGSLALQVTGCYDHENALVEGVLIERVFCAALSVAITCCAMVAFKCGHPPAGATTLIVSLGLIKTPVQLCTMMAAVSLITFLAFIINRIFRQDQIYPYWSASPPKPKFIQIDLDQKMMYLNTQNFAECFQICNQLQDDKMMKRLIEFMKSNYKQLKGMKQYQTNVPYAVRIAMEEMINDTK